MNSGPTPFPEEGGAAASARLRRIAARGAPASRYELHEELARGGMGSVHRAFDTVLRREVALKTIRLDGLREADSSHVERALRRFLDEVQVTAQLGHPAIHPVYDVGVDGEGHVYYAMPLVRGRALDDVLPLVREEREGWSLARAVGVLQKVCEAIAYAHSRGVVHRDLKPANVMVGPFGETHVMDWGLARLVGDARRVPGGAREGDSESGPGETQLGDVVGSPAYMAPEQARGEHDTVGPAADVYALGATLYHVLAGHMPYDEPREDGAWLRPLDRVLSGRPRPLHEIDPHLPAELVSVCEKAMAREPAERYPDALSMADDLRAWLEGRVVRAHRTGVVVEVKKWVARNRVASIALEALVLLAVASAALFAVQQRDAIARVEAERAETAAKAYAANLWAADAALRDLEAQEAQRRLEECEEELRGWEWRHLFLRADESRAVWEGPAGARALAVDPIGRWIASGGREGAVRLRDAATGDVRRDLRLGAAEIGCAAASPDGRLLAVGDSYGAVRLVDPVSGKLLRTLEGHATGVLALDFDASGQRLASGAHGGAVRVWDVGTGEAVLTLEGIDMAAFAVRFSPDGATLAVGSSDVALHETESGAVRARLGGHLNFVRSLAWDPTGALLATGAGDGLVRVFDAEAGTLRSTLEGHARPVTAAVFTADGTRLVTGSLDRTLRVWDAASGAPVAVLLGHHSDVVALASAPDGTSVVSAAKDGTQREWSCEPRSVRTLVGHDGWVEGFTFLRGGTRVASTGRDAVLRVFEVDSGRILAAHALADQASCVAADPAGTLVAVGLLDGTVEVLDAETGSVRHRTRVGERGVMSVALEASGSFLAAAAQTGEVRVFDATTGEELLALPRSPARVNSVAFSPDGERLATAGWDASAREWDARTGELLAIHDGHEGGVNAVAWSPDGTLLATGGQDGTVRLWRAGEGPALAALLGHDNAVVCVSFDPAGERVLSASWDRTVRLWDARTGEALLSLRGHDASVTAASFDPTGTRVASTSRDGTVRLWSADG